jgi:peptide/nickel transport system substrate-binding protein
MRWTSTRTACAILAACAVAMAGCSAGSSSNPTSNTPAPGTGAGSASVTPPTSGGQSADSSATASGSSAATGSPGSSSAPAPSGGGATDATLTVGFVAAPASLDFTQNDGAAIPQALLYNVYEGLVKLDGTGKIVPLLAESWTVSDDQKTYTFTLRKGVTFANGTPFTAEDAAFSIDRVKTGWKPAVKAKMDVVAKAAAINPGTLKVTLTTPSQSWLYNMTTRVGAMFSKTGVGALATTAIGTGPYAVQANNPNVDMVLERNPKYWGTPAALKTVTLKYFKDATAMNNAEIGGTIDVISSVQTPDTLDQFADTSKFQVIEGTTTGEVLLSFNNAKAPLNDLKVRQAISYALDRKAILDTVWAGKGTLIGSHAVPTDPWYTDLSTKYPYDPAKAKELLGGKTYNLRLRVPNLPYATAAAPVVASQLQQIGITLQVDTLDFPADWLQQVFTDGNYDMSIINHVEPNDLATIWGDPKYYPHFDNAEVQKLLKEGDAGTQDELNADYQKVTEILSEQAASDWLWAFPNLIVADVDVKGIEKNQITESFDLTTLSRG